MSFSRKWSPEAINRKADNTITFKSPQDKQRSTKHYRLSNANPT
jgi:hypothetical protein